MSVDFASEALLAGAAATGTIDVTSGVTFASGALVTGARVVAATPVRPPRLQLGDFVFTYNPRETQRDQGGARLVWHQPPGGNPSEQMMGRKDRTLAWTAALVGPTALQDFETLQAMCGKRYPYTWGATHFDAVVLEDVSKDERHKDQFLINLLVHIIQPDPVAPSASQAGSAGTPAQAAGQTPTPAATAAPQIATQTYVVKDQDTLWDISASLYGTGQYWDVLTTENGIDDPRLLLVGQSLTVPTDVAGVQSLQAQQQSAAAQQGFSQSGVPEGSSRTGQ